MINEKERRERKPRGTDVAGRDLATPWRKNQSSRWSRYGISRKDAGESFAPLRSLWRRPQRVAASSRRSCKLAQLSFFHSPFAQYVLPGPAPFCPHALSAG